MGKLINNAMESQLAAVRKNIRPRQTSAIKQPSPSAMRWIEDGKDHLNISERANTELGRSLVHSSMIKINHKVFGEFSTMEGLWHYVQSEERDDRLRSMIGTGLKTFSKKLTPVRVINFRAIIMDSNYQRIVQNPNLAKAMAESDLPFDCYYTKVDSGIRIRPNFFKWITMGYEEIRNALKENREPNFGFLMDRHNTGIYEFIAPIYHERQSAKQVKKDDALLVTEVATA